MQAGDVPQLVRATYAALLDSANEGPQERMPNVPAVPIEESVTADALVCLEDGKSFRSLKRHLTETHHTTPAEYRKRWGLPPDYPMTAKNYSAQRSKLAKRHRLGQKSDSNSS
jgi:predicted transcriptional regulator